MRKFADVVLIFLLFSFSFLADVDWEKHLAFVVALLLAAIKGYEFAYSRKIKVRVEHEVVSQDPRDGPITEQDYDTIVADYLRGEKPIAFKLAAFYQYHHDEKGAVYEGWEYYPIHIQTISPSDPHTQIAFEPDSIGKYIIGCALLDLKGKWHYSKRLTRKQRTANFESEPHEATKPAPFEPSDDPFSF